MKIKVSEATGVVLDLLVSRADNPPGKDGWGWFTRDDKGFLFDPLNECRYSPSTDWAQGGPIIEQEGGTLWSTNADGWRCKGKYDRANDCEGPTTTGPTPLIAAMRCFCASRLGDEVEVPEELR